jgi:hypothetical protein
MTQSREKRRKLQLKREGWEALVGQRIGKRIVIEVKKTTRGSRLVCKCDCGRVSDVRPWQLGGHCRKCIGDDYPKQLKYPSTRARRCAEYIAWNNMIGRCTMPTHPKYPIYGGRGITICIHWRCGKPGYEQFRSDMGEKPEKHLQLDRKDNNLGYLCPKCCPPDGNCHWATAREQRLNQRPRPKIARTSESEKRRTSQLEWWAKQTNEVRLARAQHLNDVRRKALSDRPSAMSV